MKEVLHGSRSDVWLDYFLERSEHSAAFAMMNRACERQDLMAVTTTIMKDVFYIIGSSLKRRLRNDGLDLAEGVASGANLVAWAALDTMNRLAMVVNSGLMEHLGASDLRGRCPGYEDGLLIASARNYELDYIITNDQRLLNNGIVPALKPQTYLNLD